MGYYCRDNILVTLYSDRTTCSNNRPLVVDGIWSDLCFLGWTVYARRSSTNRLSNCIKEIVRKD